MFLSCLYLVWEDALDSLNPDQLPKTAVVQPWKAWGEPTVGSLAAARASALGHAVVQSTGAYLDWEYSTNELIEGGLREMERDFLLGGEAALWTERIDYTNAECRLWPRLLAVADVLWSPLPEVSLGRESARRRSRQRSVAWQARQMWLRNVSLLPLGNARITNVGKSQSCMVSKLPMLPLLATDHNSCEASTVGDIDAMVASIMADTKTTCPLLSSQGVQRGQTEWEAAGL